MRKTFDAELQELNYEMIDMAAAAEDAIDVVTESLASGDDAAAKSAVEMTRSMDQMERDIENRCLRLLLQQQPVARDLRTISAAMKMVTDLQRIGDQCANIAEISLLLKEQKQTRTLADIRTMSQKAGVMVKRSIFAYVNRDTEAAQAVIALDDEVTPSSAPSRGSWWSSLRATGTRPTRPSTSSLSPSTWSASRITR